MKIFVVIFSFYFLALNLVPCEDNELLCNEDTTETSKDCEADHEHHETEHCSPLCLCHCCHIHVIQIDTNAYQTLAVTTTSRLFSYTDPIGKDIKDTLLQPPQLIS